MMKAETPRIYDLVPIDSGLHFLEKGTMQRKHSVREEGGTWVKKGHAGVRIKLVKDGQRARRPLPPQPQARLVDYLRRLQAATTQSNLRFGSFMDRVETTLENVDSFLASLEAGDRGKGKAARRNEIGRIDWTLSRRQPGEGSSLAPAPLPQSEDDLLMDFLQGLAALNLKFDTFAFRTEAKFECIDLHFASLEAYYGGKRRAGKRIKIGTSEDRTSRQRQPGEGSSQALPPLPQLQDHPMDIYQAEDFFLTTVLPKFDTIMARFIANFGSLETKFNSILARIHLLES